MIPSVSISKVDGGTGVTRPSTKGIGAYVSTAEKGTDNQPQQFLRSDVVVGEFGTGALSEGGAYLMAVSGNPCLLVKGAASTAADYGSFAAGDSNQGATAASAGGTDPLDDYTAVITCKKDGTVGVDGITYTYSLDGGQTESALQALGTDTTILIPDSGVTFSFTAATMKAGDTYTVVTSGPKNANGDLTDALEALRVSNSPWEIVCFDGPADGDTVDVLDTWIKEMATRGRFRSAICTARPRAASGETEAEYATYLEGEFASKASLDVVVCADVGDVSSPFPNRGTTAAKSPRPVGLAVLARAMQIPVGEDPAYVTRGPVPKFGITDSRGGPKYHNEYMYPGLDDLRITTLRTFDGRPGTFITNANLLSPAGSDFVYLQHARTINRACEIAFQVLGDALSRGVAKNPKAGPNGERYIAEGAALQIEQVANQAIRAELSGQVDEIRFSVSRTDDISSNAGATVTGQIENVALAYIKKFAVTAGFVKSLA